MKKYLRTYCKFCNDFTIHLINKKEERYCSQCHQKYTNYKYSEVPNNKLKEQRKRYQQYIKQKNLEFYETYLTLGLGSIFSDEENELIEDDAGQIIINKRLEKRRKQKIQKEKEELEKQKEQIKQYSNINRNDICLCGSKKKYKNCCFKRIKELEYKIF